MEAVRAARAARAVRAVKAERRVLNGVRALQAEPILTSGLLPESWEKIRYAGTTLKRSIVLVQGDRAITRCVSRSRVLQCCTRDQDKVLA
jgi:hypothetical protein